MIYKISDSAVNSQLGKLLFYISLVKWGNISHDICDIIYKISDSGVDSQLGKLLLYISVVIYC